VHQQGWVWYPATLFRIAPAAGRSQIEIAAEIEVRGQINGIQNALEFFALLG
jgi:hypothetical protein